MAGNSFNNILKPLLNKAIILLFISCNLLFVYINSSGFRELDKILNAGKITVIIYIVTIYTENRQWALNMSLQSFLWIILESL